MNFIKNILFISIISLVNNYGMLSKELKQKIYNHKQRSAIKEFIKDYDNILKKIIDFDQIKIEKDKNDLISIANQESFLNIIQTLPLEMTNRKIIYNNKVNQNFELNELNEKLSNLILKFNKSITNFNFNDSFFKNILKEKNYNQKIKILIKTNPEFANLLGYNEKNNKLNSLLKQYKKYNESQFNKQNISSFKDENLQEIYFLLISKISYKHKYCFLVEDIKKEFTSKIDKEQFLNKYMPIYPKINPKNALDCFKEDINSQLTNECYAKYLKNAFDIEAKEDSFITDKNGIIYIGIDLNQFKEYLY